MHVNNLDQAIELSLLIIFPTDNVAKIFFLKLITKYPVGFNIYLRVILSANLVGIDEKRGPGSEVGFIVPWERVEQR